MIGKARMAVLAVGLSLACAARAADDNTIYLYGAAGYGRTEPGINSQRADALVLQAAPGVTDLESSVNNGDTGFKVQVGWMLGSHFALEAGYVGLGSSRYRATFTGGTARADFKAGGILVDVLAIAPVGGEFSLYGKV